MVFTPPAVIPPGAKRPEESLAADPQNPPSKRHRSEVGWTGKTGWLAMAFGWPADLLNDAVAEIPPRRSGMT